MYFVEFSKLYILAVNSNKWINAWILMRIPFSLYLMPVYWFAMSNTDQPGWTRSILIFVILHILVYPASNGYNSYFDRDTGSIGSLKSPPEADEELFKLVILFEIIAIILSIILVSAGFAIMIAIYLLVSKAYSYDKIRLKKYPIPGAVVVTIFQGAFTYLAVRMGMTGQVYNIDFGYALVSTLFLAGSYPLTQVYQHREDKARGDITLSLILGIKGTFLFAAFFIALATVLLLALYFSEHRYAAMYIFPLASLPVVFYFNNWKKKAFKDSSYANYENTMKMNKISSLSLSATFVIILVLEKTKPFFWFS
jgi:1,4-dihydroxy-2-naphthoate octaprenyltransferase